MENPRPTATCIRLSLLRRLSTSERLGYLPLELRDRLRVRGLFAGRSGFFPLSRMHLADAVGLSKVRVIRALEHLREQSLADVSGRVLTIGNERGLARLSGYRVASVPGLHSLL